MKINDFLNQYNEDTIRRCVLDAFVTGLGNIANEDTYQLSPYSKRIIACAKDIRELPFDEIRVIISKYFI